MSLRGRTLCGVGTILALLFVALFAGTSALMARDYANLERSLLTESLDRAVGALEARVEAIAITAEDWAHWDDTYQYVHDRNASYEQSNLGGSTLEQLDLDLVLILAASGDVVFAAGGQGDGTPDTAGYAAYLLPRLQPLLAAANAGATDSVTGLVAVSDVPMILAASAILDSDGAGPPRGLLVFGQLLTERRVDIIARTAHIPMRILSRAERERIVLNPTEARLIEMSDANVARGYESLRGLDQHSVGILRIESPRRVHERAVAGQRYLAAVLIAMAVGTMLALFILLDRVVLARLQLLSRTVKEIGDSTSDEPRVPRGNRDELDDLAGTINTMLDAVASSNRQLRHDALHDPLTGLANRALFLDRLEKARAGLLRRPLGRFAVLLIDLDDFKHVNDALGHAAGDHLLKTVAERMAGCVRIADTVARMGGDEFGVLLATVADGTDATRLAERLLHELSHDIVWNGQELGTTASVGLTVGADPALSSQGLLREADIAMYRAKRKGKSQCMLFDEHMAAQATARLQLETQLRRAIGQQEFRIHYQPIVDLRDGTICGLEALVRWQHPERGMLTPGTFLAAAEDAGLVGELDRWVVSEACGFLAEIRTQGSASLPMGVCVNISNRHLPAAGLDKHVLDTLASCGLTTDSLRLEITERTLSNPSEELRDALLRLRAQGIGLNLDDFGAGVSSLHDLENTPVNVLKLDGSFVRRIDEGREEIIRAVISLAHALGMAVVAEGIEHARQLESLKAVGCQFAQGRLFSEPLARSLVEGVLARPRIWQSLVGNGN